MSNVVKFPFSVSRRARQRASKNGTPEERTALRETLKEIDPQIDTRLPARSLSSTAENRRLREERYEVWRVAEAATDYWKARLEFEEAVHCAQRLGMPEGRLHPALNEDEDYRGPAVRLWRTALMFQLLTPGAYASSVKWKVRTLAGGQHRHTDVTRERIERAIADDLTFLAAHPVQPNRRKQG
jgi:hypothetical protein